MDRTRFEALLEAYGADPRRWPEAERAAAVAFASAHPEMGAVAAEAARLDAVLDAGRTEARGSDLLQARILAALPKAAPAGNRGWVLALAACAVFGVALGFGGGMLVAKPQHTSADAALNAAFGDSPFGGEG